MRTSTREARPGSRWPTALARVLAYSVPAWLLSGNVAGAADSGFLTPTTLLKLGIDLGIIAFSVGMVIACLRAIKRARRREASAAAEAEKLSLSENTLETVLSAEPQALLTLGETAKPDLLVSNLPGSFGVPRDASRLLAFEQWLDGDAASDLEAAMKELAQHGEPFNMMLRTKRGRYVEADGRTAGHTLVLKVRDIAGQRLELAELSDKHKELEKQVAALRALLDEAKQNERDNAEAQALLDTHFRSFDRLATAFAVFDSTQRLASLQSSLYRPVAARCRMAEDAPARRGNSRSAAPSPPAGRARRVPRLETRLARGLWHRQTNRGSLAFAGRAHASRNRGCQQRWRRDVSL